MEKVKEIVYHNKKSIALGAGILVILFGLFIGLKVLNPPEESAYFYANKVEALLAQRTIDYLDQRVVMKEKELNEMGDMAVQTYNTILTSGIEEITDEHSTVIESSISDALYSYLKDEKLSDADYETLAVGISQIIWDTLLTELVNSDLAINVNYREEFNALTASLQEQIADIEERMDRLKVNANIRFNTDEVEANINEAISSSLEKSKGDITNTVEEKLTEKEKEIVKTINDDLDKLKEEIADEVKDKIGTGKDGKDGKDGSPGATGQTGPAGPAGKNGVDGKDGKNGVDGKDGIDGKDGSNGKSTYFAYADDAKGNGFSLTPTETSKYIGTCVTESASRPETVGSYSNWQPYRSYIMTVTTDQQGEATLHIR